MSLVLNESVVLAKTRSQDLKSVLKLNCWGSGIKDVSLVRQLINVEVIGLSQNEITTLEDFAYCPKLRELILRNNKIKNIAEVAHLQKLPKLTSLWLGENPCAENTYNYRKVVLKALPNLTILDNKPVTREELQEIEELGNEIYEEIPYSSSNSSGSCTSGYQKGSSANQDTEPMEPIQEPQPSTNFDQSRFANESSLYQPNDLNDYATTPNVQQQPIMTPDPQCYSQAKSNNSRNNTRSSVTRPQSRFLSTEGSMTGLNESQHISWSSNNNNNNNSSHFLPKGGKNRNANILSAILCLVKELDYVSCEVVQTAVACRMEETSQ